MSGDDINLSVYDRHCNESSIRNYLHDNEESEYKVFKYIYFIFDNTPLIFLGYIISAKLVISKTYPSLFAQVHFFGLTCLILSYPIL